MAERVFSIYPWRILKKVTIAVLFWIAVMLFAATIGVEIGYRVGAVVIFAVIFFGILEAVEKAWLNAGSRGGKLST